MEPLHIALSVLVAIVALSIAINYVDSRMKPGDLARQARDKASRRTPRR
ncbi:hypothetical protein PSm6_56690 [Pseudomonas solani]|jgi:hypothetical protein|uniref:Uncharacterized protein n=1 Tax=Pseudomonas solani TaxID=2731552 RepID=A0AAU7YAB5_9PSED|nr:MULTISPECIES: hypothetical protein [Pseudomonas]EQM68507.1 hypothetical protein L682_16625 [Pseudomonas alcaligenes OT 69]MBB4820734.1 uncharacterized protein (UPF0333 family) [Pseudomonas alcaligenes]MDN4146821.1 hypothetical protein [Pseudomonas tohonis]MDU9414278.1 hypothetical protein [Pseudomonas sp. zfem005]WCD78034.1 hypothetical protein PI990_18720 [Pseudomonas sp. TUM22785]